MRNAPIGVQVLTILNVVGMAFAGQTVCCTDAVYRFTINLRQTCEDSNVSGNAGITETSCMTTILPPFTADGIQLEVVRRIDIFEISPGFGLLSRQGSIGPFQDGHVLEYTSIVGDSIISPNALQVAVTAETSEGAAVMNLLGVTFENSCILPALPAGSQMGWIEVVSKHVSYVRSRKI